MKIVTRWVLTFIILFLLTMIWIKLFKKTTVENFFMDQQNVALITAHPDDESVFFSPTILELQKKGVIFFLITVTYGDYDGLGVDRIEELFNSCNELGLNPQRIIFLNNKNYFEHPSKRWKNISALANNLKNVLNKLKIETVFTFGPFGCSGHPNHIDTHIAVRSLKKYRRFFLTDAISYRYQFAFFEILSASFSTSKNNIQIFSWNIFKTLKSMLYYRSQFKFYWIFSRYVIVNDWKIYNVDEEVNDLPIY